MKQYIDLKKKIATGWNTWNTEENQVKSSLGS